MSRNYDNWERLVAAVLKKEDLWQLFHAHSRSPSVSSGSSTCSFSFGLGSSLEDASISSPKWSASNQDKRVENIGNVTSSILVKDQPQSSVDNSVPDKNVASKPFWKRALKVEVSKLRFHHRGATSPAKDSSKISPTTGSSTSTPGSKDLSPPVTPPVGGKHHLESPIWPAKDSSKSSPRTGSSTPGSKDRSPTVTPPMGGKHHLESPAKDSSKNSPRTGSSTPGSKDRSPPVTPPVGGKHHMESPSWPDNAKQESYPLPLPPGASFKLSPVSGQISTETSPSVPHTPGRVEGPRSNRTHWKKGKLLDKGIFGGVYLGFDSETGAMCAIKEVDLSLDISKTSSKALKKDIALLSSFSHPNIVHYYGSEKVSDKFYLYFEFTSGGSIHKILKQYGKLGEPAIRNYTQQILAGLAYLHSRDITHGNLKGASVLVDSNGKVKLTNFTIENCIRRQSRSSLLTDSPYWMAPEVIMNSDMRSPKMDIWSLGCTVIEMATSEPPMSQFNGITAMFKVANKKELPTIPDHLSEEGKDFVRHCLQWNPMHRAVAPMLLEHPFVKSSYPSPTVKPAPVSPSHNRTLADSAKQEGPRGRTIEQPVDQSRHTFHSSRVSKSNRYYRLNNSSNTDIYTPRYISAPVSPVGSPLPHPSSPQHHLNGGMTPPPGPHTPSPSSTPPRAGGVGAVPYPHLSQSLLQQGITRNFPDQLPSFSGPLSYWDPCILNGLHSGSHSKVTTRKG